MSNYVTDDRNTSLLTERISTTSDTMGSTSSQQSTNTVKSNGEITSNNNKNHILSNGSTTSSNSSRLVHERVLSSTNKITDEGDGLSIRMSLLILLAIFLTSAVSLFIVYKTFPQFQQNELQYIKLPKNMEDAKHLGQVLSRYNDEYYFTVLSAVFITYIFLQTFAIPGSIFLSVISGFLFSFYQALFLVCFCSATGASLCYLLSQMIGPRLISSYFPERAEQWRQTVDRHRDDLLNYIIFLRITPFLPNWFINITAPVVGVPLTPFWIGTFLGVAPPSFVAIRAGTTLHELTSSCATLSWASLSILIVLGFVSLLPLALKYKLKEKFQ